MVLVLVLVLLISSYSTLINIVTFHTLYHHTTCATVLNHSGEITIIGVVVLLLNSSSVLLGVVLLHDHY